MKREQNAKCKSKSGMQKNMTGVLISSMSLCSRGTNAIQYHKLKSYADNKFIVIGYIFESFIKVGRNEMDAVLA